MISPEEWAQLYPDQPPISQPRPIESSAEGDPNLYIHPYTSPRAELWITQTADGNLGDKNLGLDYDEAQDLTNNLVLKLRNYIKPEGEVALTEHTFNLYDAQGNALITKDTLTLGDAFELISEKIIDTGYDLLQPGQTVRNILANPGNYRLELTLTESVTLDAQNNVIGRTTYKRTVNLTVNPPPAAEIGANVRISWHFRDHLGTTVRTHSWHSNGTNQGSRIDLYLESEQQPVSLFEEKVREYAYEPFGSLAFALNAGEDGTNPRYTDHERDRFTGLNYMKGRWQLGALTSPAAPSSTAPTPKETGTGKTQPP